MLLANVLQWRWPGAHYVCSETSVVRWDGPMDQPSEAEITAAVEDYQAEQVEAWANLRATRNALLTLCDWTQITGSPLDATSGAAWASYRQALRDLPQNTSDPTAVVWPPEPPLS
mgnify:CR=1 FL=1